MGLRCKPVGPMRELRAIGRESAGPGERGYFTLTPVDTPFGLRAELFAWDGCAVATVDIDQSDEKTQIREIAIFMRGYDACKYEELVKEFEATESVTRDLERRNAARGHEMK